ncbi:MAG: beta-lactamase family protein [Flavobacteriales bacterium]|nr:beta-lactamase family protein [Flavobacteriales bacterium]
MVHELNVQDKFNGTILVSLRGEEIFSNAYGYENFERETRLSTQSSFRLNYISLQMTAMGIMILKERERLNYSDNIQTHIPEFPYENITLLHLLQQTSGLPNFYDFIYDDTTQTDVLYNDDILELYVQLEPEINFVPGEWWEYSSAGYVLLAIVIERVTGLSYAEFMSRNIFEPLEMNHTYCADGDPNQGIQHRVYGYNQRKQLTDWDITNGVLGEAGIYSSIEDLFKWDKALYTEKLVEKETIKEAYTPYQLNQYGDSTEDYGFGVELYNRHGNHHIDITGVWLGFYNYFSRNLKNKSSVVILSNTNSDPAYIAEFIEDIIADLRN